MIETNLLGRFATAEIWDGIPTPVEVVGVFLNTHNPKHPSVSFLVRATESHRHVTIGKLYACGAERVLII